MTGTDVPDRGTLRDLVTARGMAGRVFLGTAAIVCAVLVAALVVASYSARRATRESERRGLEQAADLTAQLLAGRGRSLAGGARVFVQGPYFRALVEQRQRDDILDQAFEIRLFEDAPLEAFLRQEQIAHERTELSAEPTAERNPEPGLCPARDVRREVAGKRPPQRDLAFAAMRLQRIG